MITVAAGASMANARRILEGRHTGEDRDRNRQEDDASEQADDSSMIDIDSPTRSSALAALLMSRPATAFNQGFSALARPTLDLGSAACPSSGKGHVNSVAHGRRMDMQGLRMDSSPWLVEEEFDKIDALVRSAPVVLFMRGSPWDSQCGWSSFVSILLDEYLTKWTYYDVESDENLERGIQAYLGDRRIPQLFVNGEHYGNVHWIERMYHTFGHMDSVHCITNKFRRDLQEKLPDIATFEENTFPGEQSRRAPLLYNQDDLRKIRKDAKIKKMRGYDEAMAMSFRPEPDDGPIDYWWDFRRFGEFTDAGDKGSSNRQGYGVR